MPPKNTKNKEKNPPADSENVDLDATLTANGAASATVPISEQVLQQKQKEERRRVHEELKVLCLKKESARMRLLRVQGVLAIPENAQNKHFLHLQQKLVETAYADYSYFQNQLYELCVPEEVRCDEEMKFVAFETLYSQLFVKLTTLLEEATKKDTAAAAAPVAIPQGCQPYVPPLKAPLPTFDGNYENWFAFKNMFENVMARYVQESPAIKLYHLRNALVGSAAGVIDQDIISNNDYEAAWNTLRDRYEDMQVIIDKHIDAIFNMPTMSKDSAVGLRKIIDTCSKHVDGLKNLELPVDGLGEMMLLNVLAKKMDIETRKAWELNKGSQELQDYESTMEFLKERCRVYEKISRSSKPNVEAVKPVRTGKADSKVHSLVATTGKCSHCKSDHELWKCEQFKKASISDKYLSLRKSGSCFNCLEKGHVTSRCTSEHSCKVCNNRHHTYLHNKDQTSSETQSPKPTAAAKKEIPETTAGSTASTPSTQETATGSVLCTNVKSEQDTLLATAVVLVCGVGKKMVQCRAVLDSASHKHFITEELANRLGLKRKRTNYKIAGIGGNETAIQFKVHGRLKSRVTDYESPCLELLVVKKITGDLPMTSFDVQQLDFLDGLKLADPTFNVPGPVDILIGSGLFFKLLKHGQLDVEDHLPAVQETHLGWLVSGVVPTSHTNVGRALCTVTTEDDVGKLLERFWQFDSYDEPAAAESASDDDCVAHFMKTYTRNEDGRYVVRLPFNDRKALIGESRSLAEKRFLSVERRLDRESALKEQYVSFMREYEELGHMIEITPDVNEDPAETFYLPHHCVLKPTSTTTKLRVVFDGSAESSSGVSINQAMKVGPTIQNDLISILLQFRSHRFAISADIPKMYRQVNVHNDDTSFQRILWRNSDDQPLKTYALQTVTYGLASSPFLATMALRQLAEDDGHMFPVAAEAVKKTFYIDDMLTGAETKEDAAELLRQVLGLLKSGGFSAHKICSNSDEIVKMVPEHQQEKISEIEDPDINVVMKTLGIAWNPKCDNFDICIPTMNPGQSVTFTKRVILSEISRIFDPLGFLGPVITAAKLIMRQIWSLDLRWDDPIPQAEVSLWVEFRSRLQHLNGFRIPRWLFSECRVGTELHGFADASGLAYGACLYARSILDDGSAVMKLICSKSRILPKKEVKKEEEEKNEEKEKVARKEVTTPRAELQAALLLSRLTLKLMKALEVKFSKVVLWSDSQIVLCWIAKPPEALQVYVGNRVREIQSSTEDFEWRYIPSKSNPADLISRGVQPHLLCSQRLWWDGPPVLQRASHQVPTLSPIPDEDLPELRRTSLVNVIQTERLKLFDNISRFSIIQRSMAYVIRFTDFIRSGKKRLTKGLPTADEMKRALLLIVRLVQRECFTTELQVLKEKQDFKLPLKCLNPFVNENDRTLRVGGRIRKACIPYGSKHQFLLPSKHPVTTAIIRYLHKSNLHLGQRGLLGVVRQQFWPLRAKDEIRSVVHKCTLCYRLRPKRATQLMGDLPEYRVQGTYPFATVGVDFAGPFPVKSSTSIRKPSMTKGYVCVFVCMATRSLHLKAVSNLSTDAFLGALQRFVSRRGIPAKIVSDNATNFVGASGELERLATLFKAEMHQKKLNEFCAQHHIDWSFIPPRSPHFGGLWEAGVKSVKHHLRSILAGHKLSFEELSTVLCQIEATLNSRPLTPSSDDPNDMTAITPAHFLIAREFQAIPEPSYGNINKGRLSRWQLLQDMRQKFWRTWSIDYLHELQRRQRDFKITDFKVGALVLVTDDNLHPLQWSLARITELHTGEDGHPRVVTLRTKNSVIKRAVKYI